MLCRPMMLVLGLCIFSFSLSGAASRESDVSSVEGFNQKVISLISRADHAGMLALWAEDGVDLMPGEAPLVGKAAIPSWLKAVEFASRGSKAILEEIQFRDIEVSGDWASEWGTEHQITQAAGKAPVEGYGKIALILHRDGNGQWKIKQEMWNDAPEP